MAFDTVEKDTHDVLDYGFNWASEDGTNNGTAADTGWLQGDTISDSTWTITNAPVGGTLTISNSSYTAKIATVWFSGGGSDGLRFTVVNHITTTGGRQKDRTLIVKIKTH